MRIIVDKMPTNQYECRFCNCLSTQYDKGTYYPTCQFSGLACSVEYGDRCKYLAEIVGDNVELSPAPPEKIGGIITAYRCSVCGYDIITRKGFSIIKDRYCRHCGQKIEWYLEVKE